MAENSSAGPGWAEQWPRSAVPVEDNPLSESHRLLWEGLPMSKKGPAPSLTLDQIIETAITIADDEGISGLSMRKLAVALDVGTMSLYRYVPTKTELLNLMVDHVYGRQIGSLSSADTWRTALETIAWQGRAIYLKHRWLLQINLSRPVLGPGSVGQFEETMSALKDLPFSDQEKMKVSSAVDAYVIGWVREEILYDDAAADSGLSGDEFWNCQVPLLGDVTQSGNYPTLEALSDDTFGGGWEDTFEFGLTLQLDGIEAEIRRRQDT